jgi:HK97 family phage portal protein
VKLHIPFFKGSKKEATLSLNDPRMLQVFFANQSRLVQPYSQHPAVYAAIQAKARNIGQVPLRLYKNGSEEPDDRTPLNYLFMGNRQYPGSLFFEGIAVQLDLYGEAFLLVDDDEARGGIPKTLNLALTQGIQAQVNRGTLTGWTYNQTFYPVERVIQIKYFNPYDTLHGLAPMSALMLNIETDFNAMIYNKRYFDNDGTPGMIYSTDQKLNDDTFRRLKEQLISNHTGLSNAHKAMILENGLVAGTHRQANKDLEFLSGRKFTIDEVAMVLGVPKEALQLTGDLNYSNSITASRSFWEKTLMPLGDMITDAINYLFLDQYGYEAHFDFSGISALTQPIAEKAQAVTQFWNVGVPFMEINERLKLGFNEFEGWDLPYGGRQDYTAPSAPVKTIKAAEEIKEGNDTLKPGNVPMKVQLEGMRKAAWIKLNDKVNPMIGKAAKSVRGYFRGVNQKLYKSLAREKSIKAISERDIDDIVNSTLDDDKLKAALREDELVAIKIGADTAEGLSDFKVQTMLAQRLEAVKDMNETTRKLLTDGLHDALDEAVKAGLTEGETAQALIAKAEELGEQNLKRARTIARTEIHSAFSMGRHESVKETQPKYKRWIADIYSGTKCSHGTHDDKSPRMYMHGERREFNEEYSNGCMFPLDPGGPAHETINCRCVEVYEYDDEEKGIKEVKAELPVRVTKNVTTKRVEIVRDKNGVMQSAVIVEDENG